MAARIEGIYCVRGFENGRSNRVDQGSQREGSADTWNYERGSDDVRKDENRGGIRCDILLQYMDE